MKTIVEYLQKLDLSETEAKIYLTLIENGPKRVRELAEAVGLKRTTAYLYIDALIGRGLAAEDTKESGTVIIASPPQRLQYLVDQKYKTAKSLHLELPAVLKAIKSSLSQSKTPQEETEIKYLKGLNSIRAIYEEALNTDELRSYVKVEETPPFFSNNVDLFTNAFNKNKKLKVWEIFHDSPIAKEEAAQILSKNNRYFYKLMPKDLKLTSEDILIYDDKVAIINYKTKISGVILQNINYYNNSKELFDFIWRMIPENQTPAAKAQ